MALEEIWLEDRTGETFEISEMSESLYLFYKERFGVQITHAEDRVGLATSPDWSDASSELPMKPGDPCGFVERLSWAQDGEIVEFSRTWFDTSKARYVARLR